ncbi:MAG: hypothetical protein M0Z55_01975 [Peptococcaceae bacterium]|nr:hypothetical protein [Peptococcaceae bacterium]
MQIKFSSTKENIIFVLCISLILVTVSIVAVLGGIQDNKFVADKAVYTLSEQFVNANEFGQAAANFSSLLQAYPQSYDLNWDYAYILAGEGKLSEAKQYYTAARLHRPSVVLDPYYLLEYGQLLVKQGQYVAAQQYLNQAVKIGNQQVVKQARQLLSTAQAHQAKMAKENTQHG